MQSTINKLVKAAAAISVAGVILFACKSNTPTQATPKKTQTYTSPYTPGTSNTGGAAQTAGTYQQPPQQIPCLNQMGQQIQGQYTNRQYNQVTNVVDCYDQSRRLVYSGTQSQVSCYNELTSKYGANIIQPVQQYFPRFYQMVSQQQPQANQQAFLTQTLQSMSCAQLQQRYP